MTFGDDPISSNPPGPSSSTSDGPNPIGVPDDYSVKRRVHAEESMGDMRFGRETFAWNREVKPQYFDGDEYIPANWPSTQIWQIQQAMAKIGLLTGTFSRNVWDDSTRNAYKELLALANAQGLNVDQTLQELLATGGGESGGRYTVDENGNVVLAGDTGPEVPPLVVQHADPAALRTTFRRAVIEMLGEGWSQAKIDKMVAAYNDVETFKQTEAYNMDISGQAGSITAMQSPEQFIQEQVSKQDPVGVQTNEALGFTQEFMDLAGSTAWGIG